MDELYNAFQQRLNHFGHLKKELSQKSNRWSAFRISFFIAAVSLIAYLANERAGFLVFFVFIVGLVLFLVLIIEHRKIKFRLKNTSVMEEINNEELSRLQHNFQHLDEGKEFLTGNHPFAEDLDIFGRNSLFQLINRTTSDSGRQILADWMNNPLLNRQMVLERQMAVQELIPELDWRQNFQAAGLIEHNEKLDPKGLYEWLEEDNRVGGSILLSFIAAVVPVASLVLIICYATSLITYHWLTIPVLLNGVVLGTLYNYIKRSHKQTENMATLLQGLENQMVIIEEMKPEAVLLKELQGWILNIGDKGGSIAASRIVRRIRKLLDVLNARSNQFYIVFNLLFAIDLFVLWRAELLKNHLRVHLRQWMKAVGSMEAYCSLAGFAYSHPDYEWPEIVDNAQLRVSGMGHPLIKPASCVTNDFTLIQEERVVIVTGSNMAGKSTFLRTVGINIVLGLMGGVVFGKNAVIPIVSLFTSMRTKDNLEENISSFYAELLRIRTLLSSISESAPPTFYMLDEILKGTNSYDRHKGAEALITKLKTMNALGMVSTHDVELSALEDANVVNYHFDSMVSGDKIDFDYKLKEGKCQNFNASALMKKMGILN